MGKGFQSITAWLTDEIRGVKRLALGEKAITRDAPINATSILKVAFDDRRGIFTSVVL